MRILVVDDDPQVRGIMEHILEAQAYAVTGVGSVREAMVQQGPFDLLLLDRVLPNGDGKRVAQHFAGTPMLTVSGYGDADLQKPFRAADLVAKVAERLGK
jgi:DNA-binding response OmpR family regulator